MKIVFIGSVKFSHRCLSALIDMKANVVGVCTLKESKFNADHVDLADLCSKARIPSKYVEDINSKSSVEWIRHLSPDVIFCFGWSRLLKKEMLGLPRLGPRGGVVEQI